MCVLCCVVSHYEKILLDCRQQQSQQLWMWMGVNVSWSVRKAIFAVFLSFCFRFILFFFSFLFLKCVKNAQAQVKWALARSFPSPLSRFSSIIHLSICVSWTMYLDLAHFCGFVFKSSEFTAHYVKLYLYLYLYLCLRFYVKHAEDIIDLKPQNCQ